MKKLLLITSLLVSKFLYSQNTFIEFDVTAEVQKPHRGQLIINDSISYWDKEFDDETEVAKNSFFIKKKWENKIYYNSTEFSHTFFVKDSLHNMKWELTNDTKTILDEKCNSATTHFRGRNYTAYYTTSLPYSDGPWKFGGLPGLILEVKSDDNLYQFNAVKIIKNYTEKVKPANISSYTFLEWDNYVKEFISFYDKLIKFASSNASIDENTDISIQLYAWEIIYPKIQKVGISITK